MKRRQVLLVMSAILLSAACVSNSPVETEISDAACRETVVIDNLGNTGIIDVTDDEVILSFTGSFPCIVPGDVIVSGEVSGERYGFLRMVTGVRVSGNTMILSTRNARLTDAIRNGELETVIRFYCDTGTPAVTEALEGVSGKSGSIDLSGVVLYSGGVGDSQVTVEITSGTITFDPEIDLGFKIKYSRITEFHAVASGDALIDCDFFALSTGSVNFNHDITLYSYSKTFVQWVGWVPVVEVVTLSFVAGFDIDSVTENTEITTGYYQDAYIAAGAVYANSAWSSVWEKSIALNEHPTEWLGAADLELKGFVKPVVSVAFYGVAGPYIEVVPYLTFDGQTENNEYFWQLLGGIEGVLGFDVSIFGYSIADYFTTLPVWETVIDEGSGSWN